MYINTLTKETYNTLDDIRTSFSSISLPTNLTDSVLLTFNIVEVLNLPEPQVTDLQVAIETNDVELANDGNYVQKWVITDKFATYTNFQGVIVTKEEQEQNFLLDKNKLRVPYAITPIQARMGFLNVGLLDKVETLINADKVKTIWWEYSLEIHRNNEHILSLTQALNLTDTEMDDIFISGRNLVPDVLADVVQ
jgi:hypothetical protein